MNQEVIPDLKDFRFIDIRVAKIKKCIPHPHSDELYICLLDDGDELRVIGANV